MGKVVRREFLKSAGGAVSTALASARALSGEPPGPNLVVIIADDLGYGDLGCYGVRGISTPNIDRLASRGMRFTDFYVAQPLCGASRAGLLTGCYPNRIGLLGAPGPKSRYGISDREMTLAELLKRQDYATAAFGKWHLGDHPQFLPLRHGFDEYMGLPYSNDMWPRHPERPKDYPDLPLIEGEDIVEYNPDQNRLTGRYTERATRFIERNKSRRFFLYLAHSMPHVPLHVSERFRGRSKAGLYGDVIEEIDWSVGEILTTLERLRLERNTLVVFTSDNGPWLSYGDHAGSAGPLREGKGTTWEGGVRVPAIMCWPGRITAGSTCREPAMTIDILPTVAAFTGASLPAHPLDGKDIRGMLWGRGNCQHEALLFYWNDGLEAVRSGRWKLHFPHPYRTLAGLPVARGGQPVRYTRSRTDMALFDLEADVGERNDVSGDHPHIVARVRELGERMDREIRENRRPPGQRPA